MRVIVISVGMMQTNCYLISPDLSPETIIIDPGDDAEYIAGIISQKSLRPTVILATHGHFDHIMGVGDLQDFFSIPFFISKPDQFLVDRLPETVSLFIGKNIRINKPSVSGYLYPDMTLTIDKEILKIMTAPGHTPGSICLYNKMRSICFTGDTIFKGGALGRTDHVYSDCRKLIHSVKEILSLPGSTEIMPGHGEKTTVRKEIPYYEKD